MAMIPCPKCRKDISSEASACRHCGAKRGSKRVLPGSRKGGFAFHFLMSTLLAAAGTLIYVGGRNGAVHSELAQQIAPYLIVAGVLWYFVVRVWSSLNR